MKRPKINGFQLFTHTLLMIGAWGLYIFGLTQQKNIPPHVYHVVIIVLGFEVIFLVALTISWVVHHLMLHRKLGPRKAITKAIWNYESDWLHYKIQGDFDTLKQAQVVTITCDHDKNIKIFEIKND